MQCPQCRATSPDSALICSQCSANLAFMVNTPSGQQFGPYSLQSLQQYVADGRIPFNSMASVGGGPAMPLPEAFASVGAQMAPPAAPLPVAPAAPAPPALAGPPVPMPPAPMAPVAPPMAIPPAPRACPRCHQPVLPTDTVCMGCGANLLAAAAPPAPTPPPPGPVPPPPGPGYAPPPPGYGPPRSRGPEPNWADNMASGGLTNTPWVFVLPCFCLPCIGLVVGLLIACFSKAPASKAKGTEVLIWAAIGIVIVIVLNIIVAAVQSQQH